MLNSLLNVTVDLTGSGHMLNICLLGYQLELATAFGTSHSTSSFRNNALLLLRVPSLQAGVGNIVTGSAEYVAEDGSWVLKGVGEVGLPPKKELVYEADLADITTFVSSFLAAIQSPDASTFSSSSSNSSDVFASVPDKYFPLVRGFADTSSSAEDGSCATGSLPYVRLLQALDCCSCCSASFGRAGRALVEAAVLDAWAKDLCLPLSQLIGVSSECPSHRSFYTAALNDDISLIVDAALFGAKHTPQLKIKLDGSVARSKTILRALHEALPHQEGHVWSIDANAAWSPEVAEIMLREVLQPYKHRIYMVEQPFPVDVHTSAGDDATCKRWQQVKEQYGADNMLIFADESMRTASDVPLLAPFVHGVNIKLEKCGGVRGALQAVQEASEHSLQVWFGCMVGSNVNSTTTAHMFSLACCSDLDGALLVTPASQVFSGGFLYTRPLGSICLPSNQGGDEAWGIGVTPRDMFAKFIAKNE